jgi:transposase
MIFSDDNFFKKETVKMPERTYEILESAEELLDMIKKEKRGRFRDRLRLLWLLKTGEAETMTRAAEICGIFRLTAAEWFRRYETGGIAELLRLKTVPGRQRAIPAEVAEDLKKRLSGPEGFGSYEEIRIWLMENYNLDIPYKTVHKTVRYYLGARPKSPRPSHIKKNENEVRGFKESFPIKVSEIINNNDLPVKIFSYDETGPGLITPLGKRITLPGVRPVGQIQRVYENYYIYGAAEVSCGENFFLEFPCMNTDCFQCFPDGFSETFSDSMNIFIIDNAGIHKAKKLIIPENICFIFLPPYSPELNPVERFWQHIKRNIKGKIFSDLAAMKDYVANILKECSEKTIASITGFSYILNALT